jgi:hypothetical protein
MEITDVKYLMKEGVMYAFEQLPSRSGFFFGNTDYNDNYVRTLEYTIEQIDATIDYQ